MWEEGGKQEGWRSHLETVETRQNNDRDNDNEAEYTAHVVGVNERDECAALPMPLASTSAHAFAHACTEGHAWISSPRGGCWTTERTH